MKTQTQENTLLQVAQAIAQTKNRKRVFFSPAHEEFQIFISHTKKKKL